jgi:hypothetical protein
MCAATLLRLRGGEPQRDGRNTNMAQKRAAARLQAAGERMSFGRKRR